VKNAANRRKKRVVQKLQEEVKKKTVHQQGQKITGVSTSQKAGERSYK